MRCVFSGEGESRQWYRGETGVGLGLDALVEGADLDTCERFTAVGVGDESADVGG